MKKYKILDKFYITILTQYSSSDYIFNKNDDVEVIVEGNTIYIKDHEGNTYESSNTLTYLLDCVQSGILKEV